MYFIYFEKLLLFGLCELFVAAQAFTSCREWDPLWLWCAGLLAVGSLLRSNRSRRWWALWVQFTGLG